MKRGVSEIVSWVMLIGLSVAIGVIVLQWSKTQTEQSAEQLTQDVTSNLRCGEVSMNVAFTAHDCSSFNVTNRGLHKIIDIQVRGSAGGPRIRADVGPGMSKTLNIPNLTSTIASPGNPTDFIPIIEGQTGLAPCADRKLAVVC